MAAKSFGENRQPSGMPITAAQNSEQNHLSERWRIFKTVPIAPAQS